MVQNIDMRVRVGLVSTAVLTTGGAATFDRALTAALGQSNNGVQVDIVRFASDKTAHLIVDADTRVVLYQKNPRPLTVTQRLRNRLRISRQSGVPSLQTALDEQGIDLAWFMAPNRVIGSVLKTPFVMPVWDLAHREVQGFAEFSADRRWSHREEIYGPNLGRAFHVVTDSIKTGREIERIYGVYPHNWSSIGLPLPEKPRPSPIIRDPQKARYFYYPASYWPHKNHRTVIDALKMVPSDHVSLVFSGHDEGHRRDLESYVEQAGLKERISFLGRISDEEVQGLIENSVAVLMPSVLGPTNYPPLEAWRSNVPAIVSSVHEFDEVPDSGMVVVDTHDCAGWATAMEQMLGNLRPKVLPPYFEASPIDSEIRQIVEKFAKTLRSRLVI